MAAKKKANGTAPRKRAKKTLKKDSPGYFSAIGKLGGRSTLAAKGKAYFSHMASVRHQRNREKKLLDRDE